MEADGLRFTNALVNIPWIEMVKNTAKLMTRLREN